MKFRDMIRDYLIRFRNSLKRFPLTFGYTVLAATAIILITYEVIDSESGAVILMSLAVMVLADVAVKLEREIRGLPIWLEIIIDLAIGALTYALYWHTDVSMLYLLGYGGGVVSLIAICLYQIYRIAGIEATFGHLVWSLIYDGLLTGIAESGISLSLLAFLSLITDFRNSYRLFISIGAIMATVVYVNVFLAFLPKSGSKLTISRVYSTLVNKIALVLYLLLVGILYLYFIKIIITWQLPRGEINFFVSLVLLGFCLFYLSCQGENNRLAKVYLKVGGFVMIPLMLMQGLALYIRISEYGLTMWRVLSLYCDLIALLFVIDALVIKKVRWLFAALALVSVIATIGPLNGASLGNRWQLNIINTVLKNHDMLSDGSIVNVQKLPDPEARKLESAYDYLRQYRETLSRKTDEFIRDQLEPVYGILVNIQPPYSATTVLYFTGSGAYDITGYDTMESGYISTDGEHFTFAEVDITDFLSELVKEYPEGSSDRAVYTGKDCRIVFDYLCIDITNGNGEIQYVYGNGYIMRKTH